eukprot:TRINITY_DN10002_c2_g1_i1.p1 TRINITY_DN10002_c2_g1~~TRINITY_DN10002_c2_g1_i1.p1  ORF type:complete len:357 (-),score=68.83 TRINITY_DN10002_c2_g1_i1:31-1101(-)
MPICVDPTGRTFVYSLYVETLALAAGNEDLEGTEADCRWTVKGLEERSLPLTLSALPAGWQGFCSFLIVSFPDPGDRSMCIRLAVSDVRGAGDLCVAFLDLATLSHDERFKVDFIELRNTQLQVCAVAKLHSACQQRWMLDGSVVEAPVQAHFLDSSADAQARRLKQHIAAAAGLTESSAKAVQEAGCSDGVCPKAEHTVPRDPEEEEEEEEDAHGPKHRGGGSSMGTESTDVPTEQEAAAGSEARLRPGDDSGMGGLWGLLGIFGCRPECVAARCGCNWMEAEGDGSSCLPEQATQPQHQGACREEDMDFRMPAPAVAAALSRGRSQNKPRRDWQVEPPPLNRSPVKVDGDNKAW